MDQNRRLADAFGDLARGYKKLRMLCLEGVDVRTRLGETEQDCPGLVDEPEVGSLGLLCAKTLMRTKTMWTENPDNFIQKFLEQTLGEDTVRRDKYRNAWRYNSSRKSNWQKLGLKQLKTEFFDPLVGFLDEVKSMLSVLEDADVGKMYPKLVRPRAKLSRIRRALPKLELDENHFRAYLINVHESLPSFR